MAVITSPHGYASQTDMENMIGVQALVVLTNPGGTTSTSVSDPNVIQAALDYADQEIVSTFENYGNFSVPLAPYGTGIARIRDICTRLAIWQVGSSRSQRNEKGVNMYDGYYAKAMSDIGLFLSGTWILEASPLWPQPTGPVSVR